MTAMAITKVWYSGDSQYDLRTSSEAELIMTGTPGTYATGGDVITSLATYFGVLHGVDLIESTISGEAAPGLYSVGFDTTDPATAKLVIYVEDGTSGVSAQVADMTNLAALTTRLRIKGTKPSNYGA